MTLRPVISGSKKSRQHSKDVNRLTCNFGTLAGKVMVGVYRRPLLRVAALLIEFWVHLENARAVDESAVSKIQIN